MKPVLACFVPALLTAALLIPEQLGAQTIPADTLVASYWAAVDEGDAHAMRDLVHPDSRSRNLTAYLDQYMDLMAAVRERYPDASAYGFTVTEVAQMPAYDASIPALFKDQQLEVYPVTADAFLQLNIKLDTGAAEVDVLPLSQLDGQWWLVFPVESIAWAGMEARFAARLAAQQAGADGGQSPPLPIHVELPAYPLSMAQSKSSGCARVTLAIDKEGKADDVEAAQSEPSGLPGKDVRQAVKKWRYAGNAAGMTDELVFVFLAAPNEVEAAKTLAMQCGGSLETSFLITPSGSLNSTRLLQGSQAAPDARY